jgi:hypothetical protein
VLADVCNGDHGRRISLRVIGVVKTPPIRNKPWREESSSFISFWARPIASLRTLIGREIELAFAIRLGKYAAI